MNPEQQLRHAADEMHRATASLTPPPIGQVRRSARMSSFGVAVAAAVGAIVLVGGAVFALNPAGESLPGPAGPGETTTTTEIPDSEKTTEALCRGIPVVVPLLDATPQCPVGEFSDLNSYLPLEYESDLEMVLRQGPWSELGEIREIRFIGSSEGENAYVLVGEGVSPANTGATGYECVLAVSDVPRGVCDYGTDLLVTGGMPGTESLAGRMPLGTAVVSMDLGEYRIWQRTREGYVFISLPGSPQASPGAEVLYSAWSADGDLLGAFDASGKIEEPQVTETTTAVPESDGTCSGGQFFPDVDTSGLPEPVVQMLGRITLFGSRCWFDEPATAARDEFTASFGGGDAVEFWTYEEEQGYEPMYHLMQILDMPHGTVETDNGTLYMWPAAAVHEGDWATVPEEDKEALRALYDDEDFAGFESFGAYIGYRVGIWENGVWSFFVAGD